MQCWTPADSSFNFLLTPLYGLLGRELEDMQDKRDKGVNIQKQDTDEMY